MANNIKRLRLGFLFSPREFSRLIGTYPEYLPRLESGERALSDPWIDAVSSALGIAPEDVLDPDANIEKIVAAVQRPDIKRAMVCPIGARYAILALAAKTCGLRPAQHIAEDDVADAVCSLIAYVNGGGPSADEIDGETINRLSKGLQITALTILQSCFDDPPPNFQERLQAALPGALSLIEAFSRIEEPVLPLGTE
ncbi:helix-turn-helix transcriptional regulator [Hyphococcus sp.]|uniref:helix-turn-helix transcriptional regulator n=1 Tax=Hyphococcus sp. TaxID=2038636 RepID=UPI0035C78168